MPKIIIDEFTDRKDITPDSKWRARNPEKHAQNQRIWRTVKNPESQKQIMKRSARKRLLIKISKAQASVKYQLSKQIPASVSKRNEIARHKSKGRSITDIVCWMDLTASAVTDIYNSIP